MKKYLMTILSVFTMTSCSTLDKAIEIEEIINDPYRTPLEERLERYEACEWLLELDTFEQYLMCICPTCHIS